jgi:bifunctional non-homologous end joining protein LigD
MVWTPEPTYDKPDISVRATTLYYEIMASTMLPFLNGRLLNLFRCREGKCFFQRNREHPPSGRSLAAPIRFAPVAQKNGRVQQYLYVDNSDGILACARADAVEFHGWGSRAASVETPDRMVIDLDPGEEVDFGEVRDAALQLKRGFDALGLASFALLTGGKGIHVVVPIAPLADWQHVRTFAKSFCAALADAAPERFTVALPKQQRRGRIFLDFLRNQRTATAILPYSARARDGAPVAVPVAWRELNAFDRADQLTIADAESLLRRSRSAALKDWGRSQQQLPQIG